MSAHQIHASMVVTVWMQSVDTRASVRMAGKEINVKKILMNVQAIHVSMMGNALMRLDTLCASVRANGKVNCAIQIQPVNQIPAMEMATVLVLETLIHVIVGMAGLVQCVRQVLQTLELVNLFIFH
jgi:hypothetical protein